METIGNLFLQCEFWFLLLVRFLFLTSCRCLKEVIVKLVTISFISCKPMCYRNSRRIIAEDNNSSLIKHRKPALISHAGIALMLHCYSSCDARRLAYIDGLLLD